jgi:rSAM/selenodomain-associated transferase 1
VPRLGGVKRRLAREIGDLAALNFYWQTMNAVVRRLSRDRRWETYLAVTPGCARWPDGVPRLPQGGGDLGDRMTRVMRSMPSGPVVIVGTDIPDIGTAHVARAFQVLGHREAVFGPAEDGGYWLVGLRRRPFMPRLDGPIRWSTEHALADSVARLGPRIRVGLLETLIDVDTAADLKIWRDRHRRSALQRS